MFAKIFNNLKSINIFAKISVSDAWQGHVCTYVCGNKIPSWLSKKHKKYHKNCKNKTLYMLILISKNLHWDALDVKV